MKHRRLWTLFIVFVLIANTLLVTNNRSFAAEIEGKGTADYPFLIRTIQDMDKISDYPTAHFRLMNDLDYQNVKKNPLPEFKGILNGNGKTIQNIVIVSNTDDVGLFSILTKAEIKNLTIKDSKIEAKDKSCVGMFGGQITQTNISNCVVDNAVIDGSTYTGGFGGDVSGNSVFTNNHVRNSEIIGRSSYNGGIVGSLTAGNLINCSITGGSVRGSSNYTGGIVGVSASNSSLKQCYSTAAIEGTGHVGGIIGYITSYTELSQCFSSNSIKGTNIVGGLVGYINSIVNLIEDSYSQSSVTATAANSKAGGLVGSIYNATYAPKLTRCYYAGTINATTKWALSQEGVFTNSYFDQSVTELTIPVGQARDTVEMYKEINYSGWNFTDVWKIQEDKGYPTLIYATPTSKPDPELPSDNETVVVIELTETLQLAVNENLYENEDMVWISSDPNIAAVSSKGVVTPVRLGDTMITVVDSEGEYSENIHIKIVENASEYRLTVELEPARNCKVEIRGIDSKTITWSSTNSAVATVTPRGKVRAVGQGLTLLQAVDEEGNDVGYVYIRVRE